MIIIALTGSSSDNRQQFARLMQCIQPSRLSVFTLPPHIKPENRISVLKNSVFKLGHGQARDSGVVLTDIADQAEADFIRASGGYVLHVYGNPSANVKINKVDLMVTKTPGGVGHYLDSIETFSEIVQRQARKRRT